MPIELPLKMVAITEAIAMVKVKVLNINFSPAGERVQADAELSEQARTS